MLHALCTLLNVDTLDRFLADYFPDRLFLSRGPVERLAGLVDYDFGQLVEMKKHHTKAFYRREDGTTARLLVQPGHERTLYEAGFTVYFHKLESPKINEWLEAIDDELGLVHGVTRVAGFASKRGLGLRPHFDQNDNFVCQAHGTKRWRITPHRQVKHPSLGYAIGEKPHVVNELECPEGLPKQLPEPYEVVDMNPGTVMFVPRGMWHDTETVETESLHFNIQSGLPMWKDALEFVLTQTSALHAEEMRAPIMRMFEGGKPYPGFADDLKKRLREAVEYVCEGEITVSPEAFHRYVMSRRRTD